MVATRSLLLLNARSKFSSESYQNLLRRLQVSSLGASEGVTVAFAGGIASVEGLSAACVGQGIAFAEGHKGLVCALTASTAVVGIISGRSDILPASGSSCILDGEASAIDRHIFSPPPWRSSSWLKGGPCIFTAENTEEERPGQSPPLTSGVLAIDTLFPIELGRTTVLSGVCAHADKLKILKGLLENWMSRRNSFAIFVGSSGLVSPEENSKSCMYFSASDHPLANWLSPLTAARVAMEKIAEGIDVLLVLDSLSEYRRITEDLKRLKFPYDNRNCESILILSSRRRGNHHGAMTIVATSKDAVSGLAGVDAQILFRDTSANAGFFPTLDVEGTAELRSSTVTMVATGDDCDKKIYYHPLWSSSNALAQLFQIKKQEEQRMHMLNGLKIFVDIWEKEEFQSLYALSKVLLCSRNTATTSPTMKFNPTESLVLLRSCLIYAFVGAHPTPELVSDFHLDLLATFREDHPELLEDADIICNSTISTIDSVILLDRIDRALLSYRYITPMSRPSL